MKPTLLLPQELTEENIDNVGCVKKFLMILIMKETEKMKTARSFWIHKEITEHKAGSRFPSAVESVAVDGYIHVREVLGNSKPNTKTLSWVKEKITGETGRLKWQMLLPEAFAAWLESEYEKDFK